MYWFCYDRIYHDITLSGLSSKCCFQVNRLVNHSFCRHIFIVGYPCIFCLMFVVTKFVYFVSLYTAFTIYGKKQFQFWLFIYCTRLYFPANRPWCTYRLSELGRESFRTSMPDNRRNYLCHSTRSFRRLN